LTWFVLSLAAALTQATQFAVVKSRARGIPTLVIVAGNQLVAFGAWTLFFVVTGRSFVVPRSTWLAIATSAMLVAVMNSLLARASARGDISVVGPVFALSPIFTVLPDAVLSGTLPSPLGWLGLGLATAGTVNLAGGATLVGRLRALFARRDALDALGAAVILGAVAAVDRWGALALGAPTYLVCSHGASALLSAGLAAATLRGAALRNLTPGQTLTVLVHGVLGAAGTGLQTSALTMAPAAYVNAIRRMSSVGAVLLGRAMFAEPDVGRRLVAALLASAGAACLLLAR
jgi:drug/metabolite transporter (DMT)-like permease